MKAGITLTFIDENILKIKPLGFHWRVKCTKNIQNVNSQNPWRAVRRKVLEPCRPQNSFRPSTVGDDWSNLLCPRLLSWWNSWSLRSRLHQIWWGFPCYSELAQFVSVVSRRSSTCDLVPLSSMTSVSASLAAFERRGSLRSLGTSRGQYARRWYLKDKIRH